jgi:hypothetical protein
LGDNSKWEFVLLDNTQPVGIAPKMSDSLQANDNASDDEDEDDINLEISFLFPIICLVSMFVVDVIDS